MPNTHLSTTLNSARFNLLNMRALRDRLHWAISRVGIKQSELARRAHISRGAVSLWFSGDTQTAKGPNLTRAAEALNVDPHWLATGEGSPDIMHAQETPGIYHRIDDRQLLALQRAWQHLDLPLRKHLVAIAEALAKTTA